MRAIVENGCGRHAWQMFASPIDACMSPIARKPVVRFERDHGAGLDLQHGLEVGPERPDHLVARDAMLRDDCHYALPGTELAGGTSGPAIPTGISPA